MATRPHPSPSTSSTAASDRSATEETGRRHLPEYYLSVVDHYELMSEHFKSLQGYEMYGSAVDILREIGQDDQVAAYVDTQAWGTPDQILEKLRRRRDVIGDFELGAIFRYGSLAPDQAEASAARFAREVLPELRSW